MQLYGIIAGTCEKLGEKSIDRKAFFYEFCMHFVK